MPDYRLFLLTAADRIDRAMILTCDDDEQAIAEMAVHCEQACGGELWLEQRIVNRIAPVPKGKLV